jgi:Domain of unknown function (DUF4214)
LTIAARDSAIATPNDPNAGAEAIGPGPEAAEESTSLKTHSDILETEGVVWQPVFAFNADNRYHVRDFLPLHDRAFVTAAYRAVLRREPDLVGLEGYLAQLRSGMSKAEILACLQYSAEGRLAGTLVAGLRFPYAMHKLGQWPVIGPWMGRLAAIWYLPDTERERRAFENTLTAYVMQEQSASIESLRKIGQTLRELSEDQIATKQTIATKADRDALESIQVVLDLLKSKILGVEALTARKAEKNEMETILESIRGQLQNLQGNKADRVELAEMNSIKADKGELVHIDSVKADRVELDEVRSRKADKADTAQLQLVKADRAEVEALNAIKADKVEIAHLQSLKADKVAVDEILAAVGDLRRSHGELRDLSEEFIHALEGKSDRRELSALTSSLVKLAQTQVCKDDLAALEQSIREIVEHRIKEIEKPARNSA